MSHSVPFHSVVSVTGIENYPPVLKRTGAFLLFFRKKLICINEYDLEERFSIPMNNILCSEIGSLAVETKY